MKKKLPFAALLFVLMVCGGCRKCYYCHNSCEVCQNAHFYILVQSDVLSASYYTMYTDSLKGLGWACRDTAFNKDMQVCAQSGDRVNNMVSTDEAAGYTCTQVPNP